MRPPSNPTMGDLLLRTGVDRRRDIVGIRASDLASDTSGVAAVERGVSF